jgi:hypothetical protein
MENDRENAYRTALLGVAESLCELEVCARNASRATGIGGIKGGDLDGLREAFGRLARCLEVQQDVIREALGDAQPQAQELSMSMFATRFDYEVAMSQKSNA